MAKCSHANTYFYSMIALDHLRATRAHFVKVLNLLSTEQLNHIPAGFNNSIIWNIGHVVTTMNLLVYKNSNLPMKLDDDFIACYRKGSKPNGAIDNSEIKFISDILTQSVDQLTDDWCAGKFEKYTTYETSYGATLNNATEAIQFNTVHEAMHLGYVKAMSKLV